MAAAGGEEGGDTVSRGCEALFGAGGDCRRVALVVVDGEGRDTLTDAGDRELRDAPGAAGGEDA
jgi:hypothetical protein